MEFSRLLPNQAANLLTVQIRLNENDLTRAGKHVQVGRGWRRIKTSPGTAALLFRLFEQVSHATEAE